MIKAIFIRFQVEGFHCWPGAPGRRSYLSSRHRHLFWVEAEMQVEHNDREVELHDFRDFCLSHFPTGELGSTSCEMLAENLLEAITKNWPGRMARVKVSEDGENGAVVATYGNF